MNTQTSGKSVQHERIGLRSSFGRETTPVLTAGTGHSVRPQRAKVAVAAGGPASFVPVEARIERAPWLAVYYTSAGGFEFHLNERRSVADGGGDVRRVAFLAELGVEAVIAGTFGLGLLLTLVSGSAAAGNCPVSLFREFSPARPPAILTDAPLRDIFDSPYLDPDPSPPGTALTFYRVNLQTAVADPD